MYTLAAASRGSETQARVTSPSSVAGQSKDNMARRLRVTSPVRCFEPRHLSRPQSPGPLVDPRRGE